LAELAKRQYGVVAHEQLVALGYSEGAIGRGVKAGRLHRVLRGVYAVGHSALSPHGDCMAAVLTCGDGALLSHQSSAWIWGLLPTWPPTQHVTVPARGHQRDGVHLHHSTIIEVADRAEVERLPVTSVARTLLDLACRRRTKELENAVDRAHRMDLLDLDAVDSLIARSGGHAGRRRLGQAIELYRDPAFDRARSERLFLDLVKGAGLPRPAINAFVAGHELDAFWEEERFAVEIDGWIAHGNRRSFERDPVRIEDLKLAGIDAIRLTARRIERHPAAVVKRLAQHLERRRAELRPRSH
jgi:hypothetical protein